jgi:hypothetical protein
VYLDKLVIRLYKGKKVKYFSYKEDAQMYVDKIIDSIINDLPNLSHRFTPPRLKRFGKYYVKLKGKHRTTWYAFFSKNKSRIYVKFATNNHTPQAAFLNGL